MAETYHGVEIPEEFGLVWNTAFEEGPHGFRLGVRGALGIDPSSEKDRAELTRLDRIFTERDAADQAAWKEQYDRDMAAFKARTQGLCTCSRRPDLLKYHDSACPAYTDHRTVQEGETDGTS